MNYRRSTFTIIASLSFCSVAAQQNFHIPRRSVQPYQILGYHRWGSGDTYDQKVNNFSMQVDSFEMSSLITLGEYKQYLAIIKKDSSEDYYRSQMPDPAILSADDYAKYLSQKSYEAFPVAGVSWDAAMNYCKWKTLQENKNGNLQFIYRLPQISEWLSAYDYLGAAKSDMNKNFSDWTMALYYEGSFIGRIDTFFQFDLASAPALSDKPRDKRKRVIGDSYLFQREDIVGHLQQGYFSFDGFRHVGFRLIKRYLANNSRKSLEASILRSWGISSIH